MPSAPAPAIAAAAVSVLFNEPKLLKFYRVRDGRVVVHGFSALQRAEIAEIKRNRRFIERRVGFSALQRAEIAEIGGAGRV